MYDACTVVRSVVVAKNYKSRNHVHFKATDIRASNFWFNPELPTWLRDDNDSWLNVRNGECQEKLSTIVAIRAVVRSKAYNPLTRRG